MFWDLLHDLSSNAHFDLNFWYRKKYKIEIQVLWKGLKPKRPFSGPKGSWKLGEIEDGCYLGRTYFNNLAIPRVA